MGYLFATPSWFFGIDIALELAFAVITLAVGLYSYKVYKLSGKNQVKTFSIAFSLISVSYLIQSITNFLILSKLNENVCRAFNIASINTLNNIGFYAYMLFFTIGLLTLTHTTLRSKNERIYPLMFAVTFLAILFSTNQLYIFYLLASTLLTYMVWHYFQNYIKNKQTKTLIVLVAFVFLLFGRLHFLVSVNHSLFYMIGHFLELVAYILILINLILVIRK
ncbi:hypothetical protein HQ545_00895 [Candidatus Woesearchaeota archaeon]|nr:hypothetical protein [Candidatus Woesearchaeota archaeon]